MVQFNRPFGVHSHLKRHIQIFSHVYLFPAIFCIASFMLIIGGQKMFFINQSSHIPEWMYNFSIVGLTVYSLIHPRSNPGKANWQLFLLTFMHTTRFFQSINTFHKYEPVHSRMLDKIPNKMCPRLPVDIKYLKYNDEDKPDRK